MSRISGYKECLASTEGEKTKTSIGPTRRKPRRVCAPTKVFSLLLTKTFEVGEIIPNLHLKYLGLMVVNLLKVAERPHIAIHSVCYPFCRPMASQFY